MPIPAGTARPVPAGEARTDRSVSGWTHLAGMLLPILLTLALYAPTAQLGFFHLDDPGYVVNNPLIQNPTLAQLKDILARPYFANYSPAHLLSYALDYRLAGLSARAFHLSSNLWGAAAAGLVYLLAFQFTRRFWPALFAGLLFAAHPAHVEAVAWISSRKDLVATAFALPSFMAYLRYRGPTRRAGLWYGLALVFFVLAEAAKQSVVILPIVFALHDAWVERRRDWRRMALDKLPFLLAAGAFAGYVDLAQPATRHAFDPYVFGHSLAWFSWLLTGFGDYVLYRPRPSLAASAGVQTLYVLFPVCAALLPALFKNKVRPLWLMLYVWTLLALGPPLALNFTHPVADRYLYFPSVPFCLLASGIVFAAGERLPARWRGAAPALALLALLGAWSGQTRAYLRTWLDPRSVWWHAVRKTDDYLPRLYLGGHFQDRADALSAAQLSPDELRRLALALGDDPARVDRMIAEGLATAENPAQVAAFRNRLLDLAAAQFDEAERRKGTLVQPTLYYRRGKIKMDAGDLDGARRDFQTALREARRHTYADTRLEMTVRSRFALGVLAWRRKDYAQARDYLQQAYDEQTAAGGTWVPDLEAQLRRITALAQRP